MSERRYPYLPEREEFLVTELDRGASVLDLANDLHLSPTRVRQLMKRARNRIAATAVSIPSPLTTAWQVLWVDTPGDRLFPIRKALFNHYSENPSAHALEVSLSLGSMHPGAIPGLGKSAVTLLYRLFGYPEPSHPPYHQVLASRQQ